VKKASEVLDRIILYILYGLILVLPLVIFRGSYDVVLLPKVTIIRVAAAVLLLLWTASCVLAGELKWHRTPLDIPLAGLLVMVVVSTIFSMNWQASLAGAIRQEGLWIYFIYALLYYLAVWYLGRGDKWLTALRLFAWSSLVPALMSALQLFGVDFSKLFDANLMTYSATFGNRPFYGYYLVMVIPVFCFLAWREKNRWRRLAWAAGGAVNLAILPLTNNRADTLGLLAAVMAAVILISLCSPRRRRAILIGLGVTVLVVALLFGAAWGTSYGKRLRSAVTFTSDENATARFSMWRSALHMIADRPLQGYGLESFYFDYYRYIEPGFNQAVVDLSKGKAFVYDNPHNQTLYTGVSLGVAGIFFYLLLYGLLFRCLYRAFRRSNDPWFFGTVFCAVLANFVCVQFLSDLPPHTFYLWVLVGTAVGRMAEGSEPVEEAETATPVEDKPSRPWRKGLRIATASLALCLAAAISVTTSIYAIRFQAADFIYDSASKKAESPNMGLSDLPPIIEEVQRAISLNPLDTNYRIPLYKMLLMQSQQKRSADPAWKVVNLALQENKYYPTSPYTYVILGTAYTYAYTLTGIADYKQKAIDYLNKALLLYPYYQDAKGILNSLNKL
jgi:O-antigen ligase